MTAEGLPIVCGYCRMPLRYVRGHLLTRSTGQPHFYRGKWCLNVTDEMAQRVDRLRLVEVGVVKKPLHPDWVVKKVP